MPFQPVKRATGSCARAEFIQKFGGGATQYFWGQRYASKVEAILYWLSQFSISWQVDETYIKVKGEWVYL